MHSSQTLTAVCASSVCVCVCVAVHVQVMATDGHTYEREAIERWFATGKKTSPKTGEPLAMTSVFPNHALRSVIRDWEDEARRKREL